MKNEVNNILCIFLSITWHIYAHILIVLHDLLAYVSKIVFRHAIKFQFFFSNTTGKDNKSKTENNFVEY